MLLSKELNLRREVWKIKEKKVTLPLRFGTKIKEANGVDIVINQKVKLFPRSKSKIMSQLIFILFFIIQMWGGI